MTVAVGLKLHNVSNVHDLLSDDSSAKHPLRWWVNPHLSPPCLNIFRGRVASSANRTEAVAIAKVQRAELGFANSCGVREHGIKHPLQLAGRAGNNLQHFRCCCLLLE